MTDIEREIRRDEYWQDKVETLAKFIEWASKPEYRTRGVFVLGCVAGMIFMAVAAVVLP